MITIKVPSRSAAIFLLVSAAVFIGVLALIQVQLNTLTVRRPPIQILEVIERPATIYKAYMKHYGKHYENEELKKRFLIFKKSLKEITRLNHQRGARYGLTKLSDVSMEEIMGRRVDRKLRGGCSSYDEPCGNQLPIPTYNHSTNYRKDLPIKFDWRDKGYVGPVSDQKQCNGCWAFSIAGVMETMAAKNNQKFGPSLSIQELIDCTVPETNGCLGGHAAIALKWLCDKKWGVVTEEEYPMKLVTQQCILDRPDGVRLKHFWYNCLIEDENEILETVYKHGPVMVVVNARNWVHYIDGVIQRECSGDPNPDAKDEDVIRHVVQIVGYDLSKTTEDVPYYIVKNSYGDDFGVGGYLKLAVGDNVCGVKDEVSYLDVQ